MIPKPMTYIPLILPFPTIKLGFNSIIKIGQQSYIILFLDFYNVKILNTHNFHFKTLNHLLPSFIVHTHIKH